MRGVVISDLDGTLLDHDSYRFDDAAAALRALKDQGIPVVLCTSKTRQETLRYWHALELHAPFVVENGGAVYIPASYFPAPVSEVCRDNFEVIEFGTRHTALVQALESAARRSECAVIGFGAMTDAEVADRCAFGLDDARRAKAREYGEAFVVQTPERLSSLIEAIHEAGFHHTEGGRFHHIHGENNKGVAVTRLLALYRLHKEGPFQSLGLGDGPNDAEFLQVVDEAVLIASDKLSKLRSMVPHGRVTERRGPSGWNEAVLHWLHTLS